MPDPADPRQSDRELMRQVLQEHQGCLRCVSAVEACLEQLRGGAQISALPRLTDALETLRRALTAHFEAEERGDLFRRIERERPELVERLMALRAEHATILEKLDEALEWCRGGDGECATTAAITLVQRIRSHEAEEDELMVETFWHDVGAAD